MKVCHYILLLLTLILSPGLCVAQQIFDTTIKPADTKPENYIPLLKNKKVALVINQTSRVGNESLLDIMLKKKVTVTKIFVPEHGFRGTADAGAHIDNSTDSATGIPVISLYGRHRKPTVEDLAGVDVLVYDLQDVGVRFYTYISTLEYCMEACAENHVQLMVLDRPNPNGFYVDGPVVEKEHKSFLGMQRIPIVYGMTPGEYAKMLTGEKWYNKAEDLSLKVIKCVNYTHEKKYLLPVAPSPNLRTTGAVLAYPSVCLFEGTPLSVGRGTDKPFLQYGCPEFEGKYNYTFVPHSQEGAKNPPHENKTCYGVLVGTDPSAILKQTGNRLQLKWLIEAYHAYPDKDKFFTPFFVQLAGTQQLAAQIKKGDNEETIRKSWEDDLRAFKITRKKYLLYDDFR